MDVTLSIDDELLRRARKAAKRRGISLNQMIRDLLEDVTADTGPDETIRELDELWSRGEGRSKGRRWSREDLYDRPVLR